MSGETEIRPFRVDVPDEAIADLWRRITAARLPSKELVPDRSQGVQLATIHELARYWTTDYDWRKCQARLNALPQFKTEIDGVDVHFITRPLRAVAVTAPALISAREHEPGPGQTAPSGEACRSLSGWRMIEP